MSSGKVPSIGRGLAALVLSLLLPACGKSSSSAPPPPGPGVLSVSLTTPAGVQKGVVQISYSLMDPAALTCTVTVAYSTDGGKTYQPATPGTGGDGVSDLVSSSTGVAHAFAWNSLADGVALVGADSKVRIRVTPTDTAPGVASATSNFTVNNAGNTPPSLSMTAPVGVQGGLVPIAYSLTDAQSDLCTLQPSFSVDGGSSFAPATPGPGGDGVVNLASSPGGTAHTFLWNSVADGAAPGGANNTVQIRLRPADVALGAPATTANFSVDNAGKSSGASIGGGYPIQVNGTSHSDWATAVATDGVFLYALGFENFDFESASSDAGWRLRKRRIDTGAAVAAFGTAGTLSANPGPGLDVPFKVIVSGGSLFVLLARETGAGSRTFVLRIEKRNAVDGSPVASFGTGGAAETVAPAGYDGIPLPWTMVADGSFLYIAGPQEVSSSDSKWRIEKRDKTTGQLIAGFGTAGSIDENPTGDADGCFGMVIDGSSMWLVGAEAVQASSASNGRIRMEKRKLLDGTFDAAFGSGGVVTVDAGPGDDIAEDAISDGTSLFVFARVETALGSGVFQSRIEKRNLATGSLDAVVTGSASDPTGELPFGHLALDGGSLFVCQADGTADTQWRLEKRSTATLSLVPTFGTAGIVQINPSVGGYDRPLGIVAAGGVVLLAGMDSAASDEQWRIEARWR